MAIVFTCPRCDREYSVADTLAGRRVTCKGCSQEFAIPKASRPPSFLDDADDDGPAVSAPPPPRKPATAAYLPPRVDPDPPPRPIPRPAPPRRSSSGGSPDWVPTAIKGIVALAMIGVAGGGVWYVMHNGVPTVEDIQNIGVSEKARESVSVVKEYVGLCNELADVLGKLHDAQSARDSLAPILAVDKRFREFKGKLSILSSLTKADLRHLKRTAGPDVLTALRRLKGEFERISAIPGSGNPAVQAQTIAAISKEISIWDDEDKPFGGSAIAGGKTVVVDATGLSDQAERSTFGEKLRQLAGARGIMSTGGPGGSTRYQVETNTEAGELAKQITFGKVTKVSGDNITVVASLTTEDVSAERERIAAQKADQERMKKEAEARKKADDERRAAEIAANTAPPLTIKVNPSAGPIDKALADTRSTDRHTVQEAIKRLAWGVPEERKAEVAEAIAPLLQMKDGWTAREAMKTLAALKVPESVPGLLAVLDRDEVSRDVMKTLGEIGDPRAAKPLADRLEKAWPTAQQALIAIGPAAEPAVMEKLRDPQSRTRTLACEVLAKIGGKETLKLMLTLPADSDTFVRMAATDAMKKIVERVGPIPEMKRPAAKKGR